MRLCSLNGGDGSHHVERGTPFLSALVGAIPHYISQRAAAARWWVLIRQTHDPDAKVARWQQGT
jgi:hypothetical protein